MTWTNGRHSYRGKENGRGKRGISKIVRGISGGKEGVQNAFNQLEYERIEHPDALRTQKQSHRGL